MPQNYSRPPENEGNYFRPQEAYQGGYAAPVREQPPFPGLQSGLPPRAPGQNYLKQDAGAMPVQGRQDYQVGNQKQRYYSPNPRNFSPAENFGILEPRGGFQGEDRRGVSGNSKNSIKISNPPGGLSTFAFG